MPIIAYDGELDIECICEFYVIRKKIDGTSEWFESEINDFDGHTMRTLIVTSRISDADIEGSSSDMKALARAIVLNESFHAKRCAVDYPNVGDFSQDQKPPYLFMCPPRNSQVKAAVKIKEAKKLANKIIETIE